MSLLEILALDHNGAMHSTSVMLITQNEWHFHSIALAINHFEYNFIDPI